ncbi:hypothetical protein CGLO_10643 [Colletotrichum gloeosporioides Cg-14]|uniref:Uncharacterized protein n=1 Tax=Colletotrichum gloeosporioides (strain Cg-14) TaxID=1237896 RepID=T0K394_COLGC|nr:hypothetical protein CGLO_10643 [Colletotrichum gloeosporioides Cg-14]
MSEQQVWLMLLTVWMVTFLILHLLFIYSHFPYFHALIFDFHYVLAEFYSHICEFLSFSDALRRPYGENAVVDIIIVAEHLIIAVLLRAKRSMIVVILILIDVCVIHKSNTNNFNTIFIALIDGLIIFKSDLYYSFHNDTELVSNRIFYPAAGDGNSSFENGLSPWRLQGSGGIDTDASGVKEGESHTGTHSFHAVGVEAGWFIDISRDFDVTANTAYQLELWAKSVTPGCYVTVWFLKQDATLDTTTAYTKLSLSIPAENVTPDAIASGSTALIEFLCDGVGGFGPDYAMFIDDITVTAVQ